MKTFLGVALFALFSFVGKADAMILDFNSAAYDNSIGCQGLCWNLNVRGFDFQNSVAYSSPREVYLHDDGGITSTTFSRTNGQRFDVFGGAISSYSLLYQAVVGSHPNGETNLEYTYNGQLMHLAYIPDLYYSAQGYRSGELVAQVTQLATNAGQISWGSLFSSLDQFRLTFLLPENRTTYAPIYLGWPGHGQLEQNLIPGDYYCHEWCGGLQLGHLDVAPVPLPAAIPMLAAALLGLGFFGWRCRRLSHL